MANKISYLVDVVLCIDCTGSMQPVLNGVKAQALEFNQKIMSRMEKKKKKIDRLRMRVVAFKDFWADNEPINIMPDFVDMQHNAEQFDTFVSKLQPQGGGDDPESGLEALALALKSSWSSGNRSKHRRIVVMWTDAPAHPLEKAAESRPTKYPDDMPSNLDELTDSWEEMPAASRRLLLYAPDVSPWSEIGQNWEQTIYYPSQAGAGLEEHDIDTILEAIANSI